MNKLMVVHNRNSQADLIEQIKAGKLDFEIMEDQGDFYYGDEVEKAMQDRLKNLQRVKGFDLNKGI